MQYTQQKMTDHPDQFFANLDAACLLNRAEEYGHWAKHLSNCGKHEKRVSFLEGHPECLAVQTAIASLRVIAPDRSLSHGVPEKMPAAECEILYGRCGYLHALLIRRKYAGPTPETQQLSRSRMWRRVKGGATQLRSMGDTHWDLMWSWHGSYYLGGAHRATPLLMRVLSGLMTQILPSGNLLSSLSSENDKYVQWCHGTPGLIPVLTKRLPAFG
ncbi:hypothetical protein WJX82_009050 [Trebouxia sp. C0006]